jgi:tRNA(Ile)-lysidine synthase
VSSRRILSARVTAVQAATALAQLVPRSSLHPAVLGWSAGCGGRAIWNVALSGGADSVALLLLLWAHWPERRRRLRALHFNHRLRGAASRADEQFCRRLCRQLGVPLVVDVWRRSPAIKVSEATAREARMAFFHRAGRVLWLGHQQDDIAESLLMRLARGSGLSGLAAPRPLHPLSDGRHLHLRPLLTLRKADLRSALRRVRMPWREDASNAQDLFFRNRVRRRVLPAWVKAAGRDAVAGAARSRDLIEEDEGALEAWTDRVAAVDPQGVLHRTRLVGLPRAVWRRSLQRWLARFPTVSVSRQAVDALLLALERGTDTRHSLGVRYFARLHRGALRLEGTAKKRRKFQRRVN